MPSTCTFT